MPKSSSFTLKANGGLLRALITKCKISQGFDPATGLAIPRFIEVNAIWDTGATASVITQHVVDQCGLQPTGMTRVQGVHGTNDVETYLVNILLPNNVGFKHVSVTKGDLGDGAHALIGMDIITEGDFCITNKDNITMFSFRYPSLLHVDYVAEHQAQVAKEKFGHGGSKNDRKHRHKTFGKNKH